MISGLRMGSSSELLMAVQFTLAIFSIAQMVSLFVKLVLVFAICFYWFGSILKCISKCFRWSKSVNENVLFVCLCLFHSCIPLDLISVCLIDVRLLFDCNIIMKLVVKDNELLISHFANDTFPLLLFMSELKFSVSILTS